MTKIQLRKLIADQRTLLLVYALSAIIVTIQRGVFGFPNDFAIFRAAFWNLIAGNDLYVLRPQQAHDYFKYSPSFALLFAPFAILPFLVGLFFWNLFNALTIFFALRLLLARDQWAIAQALVFLPTLRSIQSAQSNAFVAAIIILAFVCFERGNLWRGATAVAFGTATKVFPLTALAFALPRRDRLRAFFLTALSTAILLLLPLLVVPPRALLAQYCSWAALEKGEAALVGSSVMQLFRDAGVTWPAWPIQLIGCAILLTVLVVRMRDWEQRNLRLRFLAFLLVFCVVFNHRAERQSAVIAVSGMVIWLLASSRSSWRIVFFATVYALTCITGSSLTPTAVKQMLSPEARFSIPLTLLWLVMLGELLLVRPHRLELGEAR